MGFFKRNKTEAPAAMQVPGTPPKANKVSTPDTALCMDSPQSSTQAVMRGKARTKANSTTAAAVAKPPKPTRKASLFRKSTKSPAANKASKVTFVKVTPNKDGGFNENMEVELQSSPPANILVVNNTPPTSSPQAAAVAPVAKISSAKKSPSATGSTRIIVDTDTSPIDARKNLNALFNEESDGEGDDIFDEDAVGDTSGGNKKLFSKFNLRNIGKNKTPSPKTKQQQKQPLTNVPKFVNNNEEMSIPSLITEPEAGSNASAAVKRGANGKGANNSAHNNTTGKIGAATTDEVGGERADAVSPFPNPPPIHDKRLAQAETPLRSNNAFKEDVQKFLNVLQCNDDTTSEDVATAVTSSYFDLNYFDKCGPFDGLCAPMGGMSEMDPLAVEREEEEKFAKQFTSEIVKNGIKLIYHQSPTPSSSNMDWNQSTVKLFIRPGNCHESKLTHPTLAWAILPVVSRMRISGSYDADKSLWNYLGLLDIYSILGADDGESSNGGGALPNSPDITKQTVDASARGAKTHEKEANNTPVASGFFSVTASSTGNVYVFEAPTGKRRDYIVKGLKCLISRASYQMIAGKVDVCSELYSEDAGQLTGELPSLVTPTQALSRVTHAFLDN